MKTCTICGRDDLKHQGALNIHMYHCKMKNINMQAHVPGGNVTRGTNIDTQLPLEDCVHEWRFLSLKSAIERKAYNGGYKEVCINCQELKGE